ncbi:hypothetical protein CHUAL_003238 [Chamberlinius hualienensis]
MRKLYLAIAIVVFLIGVNIVDGQSSSGRSKSGRARTAKVQAPIAVQPLPNTGTQGLSGPLGKVPDNIVGCYTGDQYWPSVRLPNSLDNLVFLIEKLEDKLVERNISINASFVANLILRRFQVNGINDVQESDSKTVDKNEQIKQDIIFRLYPNVTYDFPSDAFTDREACSMHWMLSTSINTTNLLTNYDPNYDPTVTDPYRENGAIYGSKYGTFSGGPLLSGIAASSSINILRVQDMLTSDLYSAVDSSVLSSQVDPVLIATLAGEIGQSALLYAYPRYSHPVFGPDGSWNGTVCSTTLISLENFATAATKAELVGATDGMVIGDFLRRTYYSVDAELIPSLSQVLRSYFGRGLVSSSYYACDRVSQANSLMAGVANSAIGFAAVYEAKNAWTPGHQFPDHSTLSNFISEAVGNFTSTYLQSIQFGCTDYVQTRQCQTQNDIIFVMDTSMNQGYDNFQEQKNFIGGVIERIGVFPNDSHVGVVTFGSDRDPIPIRPDLSGADIRCQLQWRNFYGASNDIPQTIRFVKDKFKSVVNAQRGHNYPQAPGKVVIFINMQSSLPNTDQVAEAMDEFRAEFADVTMLAVGKNKDVLRNFVEDEADIYNKAGEQLSINVDQIVKRLCTAPATIEYKYCADPRDDTETEFVATNFVYQDTYQWIGISPWTLNRTDSLRLNFESQYGGARICIDNEIRDDPTGLTDCFETSTQSPVYQYGPFNPCEDNEYNCPWVYISIRGKSGGSSEVCRERSCDSFNQVKVTLSHEGLRCAGSQISAVLSTLIISIILILFTHKLYS